MKEQPIVLVVDDCADMREMVASALQENGFIVELAANAMEAFRCLAEGIKVSAIVTDIQMPGLSGIELIKSLRRDGIQLPVIAMTGGSDDWLEAASRAGADLVLRKPFSPCELVEKLKQFVN